MSQISALILLRDLVIKESDLHSSIEAVKVQLEAKETANKLKVAKVQVDKEHKRNIKLHKELKLEKKIA